MNECRVEWLVKLLNIPQDGYHLDVMDQLLPLVNNEFSNISLLTYQSPYAYIYNWQRWVWWNLHTLLLSIFMDHTNYYE